ncbi:MAG: hypothetical protein IMW91_04315 [Firmicutes bacterium]|nr:hypothetical protein [Bacillota bacterium]
MFRRLLERLIGESVQIGTHQGTFSGILSDVAGSSLLLVEAPPAAYAPPVPEALELSIDEIQYVRQNVS